MTLPASGAISFSQVCGEMSKANNSTNANMNSTAWRQLAQYANAGESGVGNPFSMNQLYGKSAIQERSASSGSWSQRDNGHGNPWSAGSPAYMPAQGTGTTSDTYSIDFQTNFNGNALSSNWAYMASHIWVPCSKDWANLLDSSQVIIYTARSSDFGIYNGPFVQTIGNISGGGLDFYISSGNANVNEMNRSDIVISIYLSVAFGMDKSTTESVFSITGNPVWYYQYQIQ